MSPTLCLNMIVKNESKIIERLLSSVVDIIDCYCICDTGSEDNTIEVIKTFFEKHNTPGKIVEKPFINFCVNRTYAAEQAYDMADYLLFLDADMVLNVATNFSKDSLTGPFYKLKQYKNSGFFYYNNRIASTKSKPKYYGVTHEYLSTGNQRAMLFDTLQIHDINDGGCKKNKFTRDIQLLTEGLKSEPNNARYMFYLANSYRDISQPDKAIEYYKHRVKMGGWDQEVFMSMYNIGTCYKRLGNINAFVCSMLDAWNYRPTRVEPLFHVIQHYVEKEKYQIAMMFYDKAKNITIPNDTLFIEGSLYGDKLDYLYTRIAYYCKITEHVYKKFETLLKSPNYNQQHLLSNYKYYVPIVKTQKTIDISSTESCAVDKQDTLHYGSTPSIIPCENGYIVNISLVNYSINSKGLKQNNTDVISIYNKCLTIDKDFNILDKIIFKNNDYEKSKTPFYGIEHLTLTTQKDTKPVFMGTVGNSDGTTGMCYGDYDTTKPMLQPKRLPEMERKGCIIPDTNEIIHKWFPLTVCKITETNELETIHEKPMPYLLFSANGSSAGFRYKNELWFVVQYTFTPKDKPTYCLNGVIVLDTNYNCKWYSFPFKFSSKYMERCLGIIVDEQNILFTHSENDTQSQISLVDKEMFVRDYKITP